MRSKHYRRFMKASNECLPRAGPRWGIRRMGRGLLRVAGTVGIAWLFIGGPFSCTTLESRAPCACEAER